MRKLYLDVAKADIVRALKDYRLAAFLAWEDVRQRYVRTTLGPMWIVLSTGIMFSVMGFVMANLFGRDLAEYMPFLICGLLTWLLIVSSINDSAQVLTMAEKLIRAFPIPIFTHYLRFILRNYIIFLHNLIILAIVLLIFPANVSAYSLLAIPGLLINMVILMSLCVFISLANLRYRDTHLAVGSVMQVMPFITPIFWDRSMLKDHYWIADINPFYHMVQVVRGPLTGQDVATLSWAMTITGAVGLFLGACVVFMRYRHRVIYWV